MSGVKVAYVSKASAAKTAGADDSSTVASVAVAGNYAMAVVSHSESLPHGPTRRVMGSYSPPSLSRFYQSLLVGPWKGGKWKTVKGPPSLWTINRVEVVEGHWLLTANGGCPEGFDPRNFPVAYYDANPAGASAGPRWVPVPHPTAAAQTSYCDNRVLGLTASGGRVDMWVGVHTQVIGWSFRFGSDKTQPLPSPLAAAGQAFENAASVRIGDKFYLFEEDVFNALPGSVFDLNTQKWSLLPKLPTGVWAAAAADRHLVVGFDDAKLAVLGSDGKWSRVPDPQGLTHPRRSGMTLATCGGSAILEGGLMISPGTTHFYSDSYIYSLAQNTWTRVAPGPVSQAVQDTVTNTAHGSVLYVSSNPANDGGLNIGLFKGIPDCGSR